MWGDVTPEYLLWRTRKAPAVLYLDFDGVLQSEHVYHHRKRGVYIDQEKAPGRVLFEWSHFLVEALAAAPDVRVVLSTSWARYPGYSRALKRLPAQVQERVIGATFHKQVHGADPLLHDAFAKTPRGLQIWADVQRRQPNAWCALDDDSEDWPASTRQYLIECNGELGLSDPGTRELLAQHLERLQGVAQSGPTPR